jgi:titin
VDPGAESVQSSSFKPVAAPAKPTITGVTTGATSVSIAFTAGIDNGSDITTYEYAYSSNGGSSWSDWNARSAGTTASPLIATGLLNGTTYVLKIRAINAIGFGADSDQSSSVKPVDVPAAPTITGEITAGDRGATIAFTAGFDNGLDITTYQYKYSSDSGITWSEWVTRNLGSTDSPLIVSGLLNGTTYSMRIRAINALGGGIESGAKQVKPVSEPAAPTITGVTAGPASAIIAFIPGFDNGSDITSYQYQSYINSGTSWSEWGTCSQGESASQLIGAGLLNGTAYILRIRAVNEIGNGVVSTQSSFVTPVDKPSAPTIANTTTTGDKIITIIFTPPSTNNGLAITNYRYSTNNGIDWTERSPLNLTSPIVITSALENGTSTALANGTTYPVIIAAKNSLGYGTSSAVANLMPKSAPGPPTITSITGANAKAIVNFTAAFNNGSALTNYKYSIDSGKTWNTFIPSSTISPFVITMGLKNGTSYPVKIMAINAIGVGIPSNSVPVTPVPGVPFAPTISSIVGGNNTATINVVAGDTNGSAIINYKYSVDGVWTTLSPPAPSAKTILVPVLTNGESYTIKIKAINAVGEGAESLSKSVVPAGPPFAPTITSITRGNASAIINFDPSFNNGSAITNYKYSTAAGKWITSKIAPTDNQILVEALINATTYNIQIAAISVKWAAGGAVSNSMSVIPAGGPALPKITKITASDKKVNLTFTAGSNNGSAILSYKYSYTSDSGVTWTTWTSSNWATGDTSMNIVGLTNGTPHAVKLKAINAVGEGVASVTSLVVTPFGAPFAPTITSIVRGNATATIYFDASGGNGSPINKYSYSLDNGAWKPSTYKVGAASIVITALKNGTTYSIRIKALSVAYIAGGEPSNALSVTPATLPVAPKITTIAGSDHTATINFTAGANNGSAITNYLYSMDGSTNWVTLNPAAITSPIVVHDLTNGQPYSVKLIAINDVGASLLSAAVSIIPAGAPSAPTITSIVRGSTNATITFTSGADNGSAITKYSYSLNGEAWKASTAVASATSMLIPTLVNGTTYSIRIMAISAKFLGGGAASNALSVTPAAVPALPIITTIVEGNRTATINFTAPANNGSAISNYQYSLDNGSNWTPCSPEDTTSPIVVEELTNGQLYQVKLMAINDVGASAASGMKPVTPSMAPAAPIITSIVRGSTNATINFTPGANNGTAITKYNYSLNGGAWKVSTAAGTATSMIVATLLNGTPYSIKIKAVTAKYLTEGTESNSLSVTPAAVPALPVITTITEGNRTATINFTAPVNNGSAISNYQYSLDNGSNWTPRSPEDTTSPIVVEELTNGQLYSVKLIAINDVGNSVASIMKTATPSTAPAAPTINSIIRGSTNATINFTPGANNGTAITKYSYSLDGGAWLANTAAGTATSMLIPTLINGTPYSIKIKAVTAKYLTEGAESNSLSVTPAALPALPVITTIVASDHTATINFTAGAANGSAISNYKYSLDTGSTWKPLDPASTESPIVVSDLSNGQLYSVKLIAINDVGAGAASIMKPVTPAGAPSAPAITTATGLAGVITINFTPPANNGSAITNYAYAYSTNAGSSWTTTIPTAKKIVSPISTSKLVPGTSYSVKIMAINAIGTSADSNIMVVTA